MDPTSSERKESLKVTIENKNNSILNIPDSVSTELITSVRKSSLFRNCNFNSIPSNLLSQLKKGSGSASTSPKFKSLSERFGVTDSSTCRIGQILDNEILGNPESSRSRDKLENTTSDDHNNGENSNIMKESRTAVDGLLESNPFNFTDHDMPSVALSSMLTSKNDKPVAFSSKTLKHDHIKSTGVMLSSNVSNESGFNEENSVTTFCSDYSSVIKHKEIDCKINHNIVAANSGNDMSNSEISEDVLPDVFIKSDDKVEKSLIKTFLERNDYNKIQKAHTVFDNSIEKNCVNQALISAEVCSGSSPKYSVSDSILIGGVAGCDSTKMITRDLARDSTIIDGDAVNDSRIIDQDRLIESAVRDGVAMSASAIMDRELVSDSAIVYQDALIDLEIKDTLTVSELAILDREIENDSAIMDADAMSQSVIVGENLVSSDTIMDSVINENVGCDREHTKQQTDKLEEDNVTLESLLEMLGDDDDDFKNVQFSNADSDSNSIFELMNDSGGVSTKPKFDRENLIEATSANKDIKGGNVDLIDIKENMSNNFELKVSLDDAINENKNCQKICNIEQAVRPKRGKINHNDHHDKYTNSTSTIIINKSTDYHCSSLKCKEVNYTEVGAPNAKQDHCVFPICNENNPLKDSGSKSVNGKESHIQLTSQPLKDYNLDDNSCSQDSGLHEVDQKLDYGSSNDSRFHEVDHKLDYDSSKDSTIYEVDSKLDYSSAKDSRFHQVDTKLDHCSSKDSRIYEVDTKLDYVSAKDSRFHQVDTKLEYGSSKDSRLHEVDHKLDYASSKDSRFHQVDTKLEYGSSKDSRLHQVDTKLEYGSSKDSRLHQVDTKLDYGSAKDSRFHQVDTKLEYGSAKDSRFHREDTKLDYGSSKDSRLHEVDTKLEYGSSKDSRLHQVDTKLDYGSSKDSRLHEVDTKLEYGSSKDSRFHQVDTKLEYGSSKDSRLHQVDTKLDYGSSKDSRLHEIKSETDETDMDTMSMLSSSLNESTEMQVADIVNSIIAAETSNYGQDNISVEQSLEAAEELCKSGDEFYIEGNGKKQTKVQSDEELNVKEMLFGSSNLKSENNDCLSQHSCKNILWKDNERNCNILMSGIDEGVSIQFQDLKDQWGAFENEQKQDEDDIPMLGSFGDDILKDIKVYEYLLSSMKVQVETKLVNLMKDTDGEATSKFKTSTAEMEQVKLNKEIKKKDRFDGHTIKSNFETFKIGQNDNVYLHDTVSSSYKRENNSKVTEIEKSESINTRNTSSVEEDDKNSAKIKEEFRMGSMAVVECRDEGSYPEKCIICIDENSCTSLPHESLVNYGNNKISNGIAVAKLFEKEINDEYRLSSCCEMDKLVANNPDGMPKENSVANMLNVSGGNCNVTSNSDGAEESLLGIQDCEINSTVNHVPFAARSELDVNEKENDIVVDLDMSYFTVLDEWNISAEERKETQSSKMNEVDLKRDSTKSDVDDIEKHTSSKSVIESDSSCYSSCIMNESSATAMDSLYVNCDSKGQSDIRESLSMNSITTEWCKMSDDFDVSNNSSIESISGKSCSEAGSLRKVKKNDTSPVTTNCLGIVEITADLKHNYTVREIADEEVPNKFIDHHKLELNMFGIFDDRLVVGNDDSRENILESVCDLQMYNNASCNGDERYSVAQSWESGSEDDDVYCHKLKYCNTNSCSLVHSDSLLEHVDYADCDFDGGLWVEEELTSHIIDNQDVDIYDSESKNLDQILLSTNYNSGTGYGMSTTGKKINNLLRNNETKRNENGISKPKINSDFDKYDLINRFVSCCVDETIEKEEVCSDTELETPLPELALGAEDLLTLKTIKVVMAKTRALLAVKAYEDKMNQYSEESVDMSDCSKNGDKIESELNKVSDLSGPNKISVVEENKSTSRIFNSGIKLKSPSILKHKNNLKKPYSKVLCRAITLKEKEIQNGNVYHLKGNGQDIEDRKNVEDCSYKTCLAGCTINPANSKKDSDLKILEDSEIKVYEIGNEGDAYLIKDVECGAEKMQKSEIENLDPASQTVKKEESEGKNQVSITNSGAEKMQEISLDKNQDLDSQVEKMQNREGKNQAVDSEAERMYEVKDKNQDSDIQAQKMQHSKGKTQDLNSGVEKMQEDPDSQAQKLEESKGKKQDHNCGTERMPTGVEMTQEGKDHNHEPGYRAKNMEIAHESTAREQDKEKVGSIAKNIFMTDIIEVNQNNYKEVNRELLNSVLTDEKYKVPIDQNEVTYKLGNIESEKPNYTVGKTEGSELTNNVVRTKDTFAKFLPESPQKDSIVNKNFQTLCIPSNVLGNTVADIRNVEIEMQKNTSDITRNELLNGPNRNMDPQQQVINSLRNVEHSQKSMECINRGSVQRSVQMNRPDFPYVENQFSQPEKYVPFKNVQIEHKGENCQVPLYWDGITKENYFENRWLKNPEFKPNDHFSKEAHLIQGRRVINRDIFRNRIHGYQDRRLLDTRYMEGLNIGNNDQSETEVPRRTPLLPTPFQNQILNYVDKIENKMPFRNVVHRSTARDNLLSQCNQSRNCIDPLRKWQMNRRNNPSNIVQNQLAAKALREVFRQNVPADDSTEVSSNNREVILISNQDKRIVEPSQKENNSQHNEEENELKLENRIKRFGNIYDSTGIKSQGLKNKLAAKALKEEIKDEISNFPNNFLKEGIQNLDLGPQIDKRHVANPDEIDITSDSEERDSYVANDSKTLNKGTVQSNNNASKTENFKIQTYKDDVLGDKKRICQLLMLSGSEVSNGGCSTTSSIFSDKTDFYNLNHCEDYKEPNVGVGQDLGSNAKTGIQTYRDECHLVEEIVFGKSLGEGCEGVSNQLVSSKQANLPFLCERIPDIGVSLKESDNLSISFEQDGQNVQSKQNATFSNCDSGISKCIDESGRGYCKQLSNMDDAVIMISDDEKSSFRNVEQTGQNESGSQNPKDHYFKGKLRPLLKGDKIALQEDREYDYNRSFSYGGTDKQRKRTILETRRDLGIHSEKFRSNSVVTVNKSPFLNASYVEKGNEKAVRDPVEYRDFLDGRYTDKTEYKEYQDRVVAANIASPSLKGSRWDSRSGSKYDKSKKPSRCAKVVILRTGGDERCLHKNPFYGVKSQGVIAAERKNANRKIVELEGKLSNNERLMEDHDDVSSQLQLFKSVQERNKMEDFESMLWLEFYMTRLVYLETGIAVYNHHMRPDLLCSELKQIQEERLQILWIVPTVQQVTDLLEWQELLKEMERKYDQSLKRSFYEGRRDELLVELCIPHTSNPVVILTEKLRNYNDYLRKLKSKKNSKSAVLTEAELEMILYLDIMCCGLKKHVAYLEAEMINKAESKKTIGVNRSPKIEYQSRTISGNSEPSTVSLPDLSENCWKNLSKIVCQVKNDQDKQLVDDESRIYSSVAEQEMWKVYDEGKIEKDNNKKAVILSKLADLDSDTLSCILNEHIFYGNKSSECSNILDDSQSNKDSNLEVVHETQINKPEVVMSNNIGNVLSSGMQTGIDSMEPQNMTANCQKLVTKASSVSPMTFVSGIGIDGNIFVNSQSSRQDSSKMNPVNSFSSHRTLLPDANMHPSSFQKRTVLLPPWAANRQRFALIPDRNTSAYDILSQPPPRPPLLKYPPSPIQLGTESYDSIHRNAYASIVNNQYPCLLPTPRAGNGILPTPVNIPPFPPSMIAVPPPAQPEVFNPAENQVFGRAFYPVFGVRNMHSPYL